MLYYQDVKNIVKVYAIQVLCLQWQGGANTPPKPIPTRRTAPGLIDAIPVFLNTCAITYRLAHDNENESITVKSMWYELLLDLLTQATIECYLCDSYNSIDALLEIFSYGDIDPSDYHSDDSESDDDDDPHFAATRAGDYGNVQHIWMKFRQKKKERMEEVRNNFLRVKKINLTNNFFFLLIVFKC